MKILIPEKQVQNVLAAVRSLRNHHIALASSNGAYKSRIVSRYVDETYKVTDPRFDPNLFCVEVRDIAEKGEFDVILPFGHASTAAISYFRDLFDTPCPTPDYSVLKYGHDKMLTWSKCVELKIPRPNLYGIHGEYSGAMDYPVVVKARKNCGVNTGIRYARDAQELHSAIEDVESHENIGRLGEDEWISEFHDPMIQEYVPGPIVDCVGVFHRGEQLFMMTQERVETTPIRGGVGAYNVTTNDLTLRGITYRLLKYINWQGPFQAEFKVDIRDGSYKLLELNPKMWGTMELAMKAGIDVPIIAISSASNFIQLIPEEPYRIGEKMIWPPLVLDNLCEDPSLGRLAMMFYRPINLLDPKPDIIRLGGVLRRNMIKRMRVDL